MRKMLRDYGADLYRTPPAPNSASAVERRRRRPHSRFDLATSLHMFENLRRSLRDLVDARAGHGNAPPSLAQMRETLVGARVGLSEMRQGVEESRLTLAGKRRELETVQRRKAQAEAIGDHETVRVAERYEAELASRVDILARKLGVQEDELALGEHEVSEMTAELRKAIGGAPGAPPQAMNDPESAALDELSSLERSRARAERDANADERLADLKRRMGK